MLCVCVWWCFGFGAASRSRSHLCSSFTCVRGGAAARSPESIDFIMFLASAAASAGYTFLPYGSTKLPPRVVQGESIATAALVVKADSVSDIQCELQGQVVATRELDCGHTLLLVCTEEREFPHAEYALELDAGPFDTLDDAAALCKRWLLEFWECHRLDDESGTNSCFEFGACHKRCWWRSSIGEVLLRLDTIGVDQASVRCSSSCEYLLERSAADASSQLGEAEPPPPSSKSLLLLRGSLVSFGEGLHYAGLRPLADSYAPSRTMPIRMTEEGDSPRRRSARPSRPSSSSSTCSSSSSSQHDVERPPLVVKPCTESGKGLGAFAAVPIAEGAYVSSYAGEVLTQPEVLDRYGVDRTAGVYLFELRSPSEAGANDGVYIDGARTEHPSRYINHAQNGNLMPVMGIRGAGDGAAEDGRLFESAHFSWCGPVLKVRRRNSGRNAGNAIAKEGDTNRALPSIDLPSIDFYAARDIAVGEEVMFDYGLDYWVDRGVIPLNDERGVELALLRARRWWEASLPALKAARFGLPL